MILEEPLTLLVNQWSHDYHLGFHIVHVTAGKFCSMALIAVLTPRTWKSVCIFSIPFYTTYIPLKVLTSRISLTIKSFFSWWSIIFIILMSLTLYRLTLVFIFSILFSAHLSMCWQREFVQQSKVSLVGDYFLYSHDINVWFSGDNVGRN